MIPLIFILQMLLCSLKLADDITFILAVLLWLIFGGHQWLVVSSWLQPPVQCAQAQLVDEKSEKQFVLAETSQQHCTVDAASFVPLSCSPIVILSIAPRGSDGEKTVWRRSAVANVIDDTAAASHAVTATSDLTGPKSALLERNDRVEHDGSAASDECHSIVFVDTTLKNHLKLRTAEDPVASSSSLGQTAITEPMNETAHGTTRTATSVCVNILAATIQEHAHAISILTNLHNVVQVQGSTACKTTSDIPSGSEGGLMPTTSEFPGGSSTRPSSEDGGVVIDERLGDDDDDNHVVNIGTVEGQADLELCLKHHTIVSPVEVARLMEAHDNPTFCEGRLDNVRREALYRRYRSVRDFYNQDETASDFTGLASWPDRSVSGDEKDIYGMLGQGWHYLSSQMQQYIVNNGFRELIRIRDGITGLNLFSTQLELAWHRNNPLMMNGGLPQVTDIKDVYICQISKTRSHRTPYSTSSRACSGFSLNHRQYLTDEQEVLINQGSVEYIEETANAKISGRLQDLRASSRHGQAQLDNPVLGWLDGMERVEQFDANDCLPCNCGRKAMHDQLRFRYTAEPGYNPSQYAYAAPEPGFLLDEALELDRRKKMLDASYYGPAVGFPRSQSVAQICDLHAIPSNNLWILVDDCVEDANKCLSDATGDLPVPGFVNLQRYPHGFRIPRGFLEVERDELPPRCKHGYLHPPFADHCNRCFPNGEHENCPECDTHGVAREIERDPSMEAEYEIAWEQYDQGQLTLASKAIVE
ncbi:uncharacterized protein EKO05_0005902 [Ascochyta rabiei]|uniref:uncharacterized protein n=1 Tax=Didymella rabiei TaxID=5454 RepID=UPI00220AC7A9|nr:uncharacterized protein EKO05_0005902 [Ascochyta rabiei]UPX15456.1 hypothetical protein EKO05_0005902 [Ascochyta rabiei]